MKTVLLGNSIMLFGIAVILISKGNVATFGFGIAFVGLLITAIGVFRPENK